MRAAAREALTAFVSIETISVQRQASRSAAGAGRRGRGMLERSAAFVIVVTVSALVLAAGAAGGGGASARAPVTFDLSSATCSQLPSGTIIHGTGTASFFATPNGNLHSLVSGTATDGQGGFWRFNYAQNVRPLGGGPVEVSDHFNLVGSGSPIKLHSHFVIDFTSSDLETADLIAIKQIHGDPVGCDPI
jgi:hypothetical protein